MLMNQSETLFKLMAALVFLTSCSGDTSSRLADDREKEAWDRYNAPSQLLRDYVDTLADLPLSGQTSLLPWPDSYWPSNRGGVAYRWRTGETPWNTRRYSRTELLNASNAVLAALSPAEKYDVLRGRYDYPMTMREVQRTSPTNASWWGLCHGWAAAAIGFEEPQPTAMINADGLTIPFGSSDVKALLTFAQQDSRVAGPTDFLGLRCEGDFSAGDPNTTPECKGVNSGSFHIILSNRLGLNDQPFIMDINRDREVWNQPVFGYESEIEDNNVPLYATAAPGTVSILRVKTKVQYVVEQGPFWNAVGSQDVNQVVTRTYRYTLELNAQGEIIGGEWDDDRRPDFLWAQAKPNLVGDYQQLAQLYARATGGDVDDPIDDGEPIDDEPIEDDPIDDGDPVEDEPIEDDPIDDADPIEDPISNTGLCSVAVSCVHNGRDYVLFTDAYDATQCASGYSCPSPDNVPVLGAWGSCQRGGERQILRRACR